MSLLKTIRSIALVHDSVLDASCIGPPNRRNSFVFSMTLTLREEGIHGTPCGGSLQNKRYRSFVVVTRRASSVPWQCLKRICSPGVSRGATIQTRSPLLK
ncbi:unnamed protein product [Ascophyllum nodosum]